MSNDLAIGFEMAEKLNTPKEIIDFLLKSIEDAIPREGISQGLGVAYIVIIKKLQGLIEKEVESDEYQRGLQWIAATQGDDEFEDVPSTAVKRICELYQELLKDWKERKDSTDNLSAFIMRTCKGSYKHVCQYGNCPIKKTCEIRISFQDK